MHPMSRPDDFTLDLPPIPRMPRQQVWAVADAIGQNPSNALSVVRPALNAYPKDPELLLMAAIAALFEERPDKSLAYQKRYVKHFVPAPGYYFLQAVALAQQGHWPQAGRLVRDHRLANHYIVTASLPELLALPAWHRRWLARIDRENKRLVAEQKKQVAHREIQPARTRAAAAANADASIPIPLPPPPAPAVTLPELPAALAAVSFSLNLPKVDAIELPSERDAGDSQWFQLRSEFVRLSLLQGFDELLCLPLLHSVETFWYQIETVRKVLKQFRGRVLLADEVGLGKTVEAGMVLKEYLLRGMVDRVLILTPASMVGQWLEEMETKFDLKFGSTYDNLLRADPRRFWSQPRVIASIAAARRAEHFEVLRWQPFDLVIVDEAHHLKNRNTSNWKLVDALQKRFLLLLSATPVQNSLVELYNLLTLLKPGIFSTEKDFRATYMTAGRPRLPANRDRMRDLMRDAMIRNTRSQVDVKLPRRYATTLRLDPQPQEAECYAELSQLAHGVHRRDGTHHRLALRHLLAAAGSSPSAAAAALHRFIATNQPGDDWSTLYARYRGLGSGGKELALIDLLKRNPGDKKIVFVHYRETLERLSGLLPSQGFALARFDGSMSGIEKDAAIAAFRDDVPLLLCTESGGEGRNLQFCNTLINFDLPWNPMAIEQRIGRLHRIGQQREVFVFNLAIRNTIEEYLLGILDEKINMFEMVVGEIGEILGELDDQQDFAEMIFDAWIAASEKERPAAFAGIGERLVSARQQYEEVKELDENLFGADFGTE